MAIPGLGKFFHKDKKEDGRPRDFSVEKKVGLPEIQPRPVPETREEEPQKEKEPIVPEGPLPEREGPSGVTPPVQIPPTPKLPPEPKSETLRRIESILEESLGEVYTSLDESTKLRFKVEGEQTARRIEQIIQGVKVKVKQVLDLIRRWLLIIPGVNRFFIEQETKIKTDKIMALRKK